MTKVLIVDDEVKITKLLSEKISSAGYEVQTCTGAEEAEEVIKKKEIDVVLCDLRLGGMDGLELLRKTKQISPFTDFVIMTAYASSDTAVEAMKLGAYEYLIKPFKMDEVLLLLNRIKERRSLINENIVLRQKVQDKIRKERIVGNSQVIKYIREMIARVAPTDSPVLIEGESGTGKELVATEIHAYSKRKDKPLIVVNCAAVPETLIEAELFGFKKGAFTGAVQEKPGQFKLADGGTIFLDEIGEVPLSIQAKLLRAIEQGEFTPLGSAGSIKVDVRIIAATNRNLKEMVEKGTFREDLYFRLNVFPINIPPLRERPEDIAPIAEHILAGWNVRHQKLSAEVIEKLESYSWPGNVRELRNILERALILSGGEGIKPEHIVIQGQVTSNQSLSNKLSSLLGRMSLPELERRMVILALEKTNWNKSRAAELLGITRRALYGRLEKFNISERPQRGVDSDSENLG